MATPTENKTRIDSIVNNSVKIDSNDFTDQDKRDLIDVLFPNGVILHYLDPKIQEGDKVYGNPDDPLIPDYSFIAEVATGAVFPIVTTDHLDNIYQY